MVSVTTRGTAGATVPDISLCPLMGTELFQLQMPVPLTGDIDTSDAGLAAVIATRTGRADIVLHAVHWRSVYESATSRRRCESRARKGVTIVDVGSKAELRDDGGPPRAAYGFAPGDMALIRPDGYIGVLASGGDHGALDDYLKQFA